MRKVAGTLRVPSAKCGKKRLFVATGYGTRVTAHGVCLLLCNSPASGGRVRQDFLARFTREYQEVGYFPFRILPIRICFRPFALSRFRDSFWKQVIHTVRGRNRS